MGSTLPPTTGGLMKIICVRHALSMKLIVKSSRKVMKSQSFLYLI